MSTEKAPSRWTGQPLFLRKKDDKSFRPHCQHIAKFWHESKPMLVICPSVLDRVWYVMKDNLANFA
jgi:hypothetical protein